MVFDEEGAERYGDWGTGDRGVGAGGGQAPTGEAAPGGDEPEVVNGGGPVSLGPAGGGEPQLVSDGGPADAERKRAIEAVLMVAESPVEPALLAQLLETSPARVVALCEELAEGYQGDGRGFVLVKVAGGFRFQSHQDLAPYVERFVLEGQPSRLSAAALETLAIVAYKQPVSRAQVASIRGVNSDGVLRTLCQRGYVAEVGHDPGPGQAVLYGTTAMFLERLGLDGVEDLPPLGEFVPGAEVMEALEQGLRPSG